MFKKLGMVVLVFYAAIGMGFTSVFVAMQFGWLNVRGSSLERDQFFSKAVNAQSAPLTKAVTTDSCVERAADGKTTGACVWNQGPEWEVVKAGLAKDANIIQDVSNKTGVSPRMIAAVIVPEQLRFFTAERESFKKFFEPLKVLGSMTKFSLGVSGIKQDTAQMIERNTVDSNSVFYPGPGYADLVAYKPGVNKDAELYNRLTDNKNHYYAYLYTALYIKEITAQWEREGYDIKPRPDVTVTLFNIGFAASKPKDSPQIGGSLITLNGKTFNFGLLGTSFYRSDELVDLFPR